jgi:hypothetical protein
MKNKEVNDVSLENVSSINELLVILNHYQNHTLAASLMLACEIILSLDKDIKVNLNQMMNDDSRQQIQNETLIDLVNFFANNTLHQYIDNKEAIDARFSSNLLH